MSENKMENRKIEKIMKPKHYLKRSSKLINLARWTKEKREKTQIIIRNETGALQLMPQK